MPFDPIHNRRFGLGGVQLVKGLLNMAEDEALQLQNMELVPDDAIGGQDVCSKRGGLQALNGSALAGSVTGLFGWGVKTTFTRTLMAALGSATSNTFRTSTDGTTFANATTPAAPADFDKYVDQNDKLDARRHAAFQNVLFYPGNGYTKGSGNPILIVWDGTSSFTITDIPPSPEVTAGSYSNVIVDMLSANGKVYLAVNETGDAAPNNNGRVLQLDLESGDLRGVCSPFGTGTGTQRGGGAPACLAFFNGQLFVGQNHESTTDAIGNISRCYPDVDTSWTADVATLTGSVSSLCVFQGALYAGTQSSVAAAEKVYVRSLTANTWSATFTGVGAGGTGHVTNLIVYNNELYAAQYHSTAPTIHIKKFDGSSWSTDRDLDASDSAIAGLLPGGSAILGSDLFFVIRASSASATDGFLMRKRSGTWTKVESGNFQGPISVITVRT
jgi:hypothetical protein